MDGDVWGEKILQKLMHYITLPLFILSLGAIASVWVLIIYCIVKGRALG